MSDQQEHKFVNYGLSAEIAADLADNDLGTPALIKAASDEDVEAAVGSDNLAAVRTLFPGERA